MGTSRTKKMLAGLALAGTVGVGGLAVSAVNPLGPVGAATSPSTTVVAKAGPQGARGDHGPQKALKEVLDALVKDGTINQSQADKITSALTAKVSAERTEHQAQHEARRTEMLGAASKAIGISSADLETALKSGKTLAEVAKANNVEPQMVIDALVADATARIDKAVADGKITADQATERKADLATRIADQVNNGKPGQGPGGGRGHRGPGGGRAPGGMGGPGGPGVDGGMGGPGGPGEMGGN